MKITARKGYGIHIILEIFGWIAAAGSIISNLLVAQKKAFGFKLWTFATLVLFIIAIVKGEWSQVFLFGVYECLNIYGWYKWKK